jgi:uncharacterized membrane protein YeaQ/YmgE (transglycosylase-associated protein family)
MDISYIIGAIIVGLIAGFVARALVPGKDSMGLIPTIILGLVGSFLGSILFLAIGIGDSDKFDLGGIIGAIIGAIIALVIFNMVTGRKKGGHATPVTRT